jgi:hypothetical protein
VLFDSLYIDGLMEESRLLKLMESSLSKPPPP